MKTLIALDKFKDSMSAKIACAAAADAIHEVHPDWESKGAPLTDGGDGFCEILTEAMGGRFQQLQVLGPRFREKSALLGFVKLEWLPRAALELLKLPPEGELAIVEMAQASGLETLRAEERNCLHTASFGTGELLAYAIEQGAAAILLGIGGSATSDLGLGALEAMGLQFRDEADRPLLHVTPASWKRIHHCSGSLQHPGKASLPPIRIACDVRNPLLGEEGAAAVYGPQKGLDPDMLPTFEKEGGRLARMLLRHFKKGESLIHYPGAGAAGGIGFGLMAAADAALIPGFDLVTQWLQLEKRVAESDVIITGEGKFDASSLQGKGPFAIMGMAGAHGDKVLHLIAGEIAIEKELDKMKSRFKQFTASSIAHPEWTLEKNLKCGPERLRETLMNLFDERKPGEE